MQTADAAGVPPAPAGLYPTQVEELTPAWVTACLHAGGALAEGALVTSLSPAVVGEGAGTMSTVYRVSLTYAASPAGGQGPETVITKFTTPIAGNRALGMGSGVYERESNFFREIAPLGLVPVPRCYATHYDAETGDSVLLLEDMAGYRDGDQVLGCDATQAKSVIDAIVPLHIHYWGDVRAGEKPWLWQVDSPRQIAAITGAVSATWDRCVLGFGDLMTGELKAAGPRYIDGLPDLLQRMGKGPQTIVHGDLRLDNLLFGASPGQHGVVPIDWQVPLASTGLTDVSYLVSQNVTLDQRRQHERELIEHYHQRLVEGGVEDLTLDDCWETHRLATLYVLSYAIITCGGLDAKNERGRRFMEAMIGRASDTVADHGSLELLASL